jgi:hypothetical protein
MNLYNEMMFIFLWFWFVAVGCATVCSLISWTFHLAFLSLQVTYVRNRLFAMGKLRQRRKTDNTGDDASQQDVESSSHTCLAAALQCGTCCRRDTDRSHSKASATGSSSTPSPTAASDYVEQFVNKFLLRDGCFIVRLIAKNSTDLIAAELIASVYEQFLKTSRRRAAAATGGGGPGLPMMRTDGGAELTDRYDKQQPLQLGSTAMTSPSAPDYNGIGADL